MELTLESYNFKRLSRGGEWYSENSGSRKFLFRSRNLGGVLKSLEVSFSFVSMLLGFSEFWPRGLGVSDFCFNGFDQNYDLSVYLIKNVR